MAYCGESMLFLLSHEIQALETLYANHCVQYAFLV